MPLQGGGEMQKAGSLLAGVRSGSQMPDGGLVALVPPFEKTLAEKSLSVNSLKMRFFTENNAVFIKNRLILSRRTLQIKKLAAFMYRYCFVCSGFLQTKLTTIYLYHINASICIQFMYFFTI